jgi:hypothetical protein
MPRISLSISSLYNSSLSADLSPCSKHLNKPPIDLIQIEAKPKTLPSPLINLKTIEQDRLIDVLLLFLL